MKKLESPAGIEADTPGLPVEHQRLTASHSFIICHLFATASIYILWWDP